jgi:phosphopantetheinyl transferase
VIGLPQPLEWAVASIDELRDELASNCQFVVRDLDDPHFADVARRELWALGRYFLLSRLYPRLTMNRTAVDPRDLRIVTRNGLGRGTQPRLYCQGRLVPWRISLAHTNSQLAMAFSVDRDTRVGIDVVDDSAAAAMAVRCWSTLREREQLLGRTEADFAKVWSMKEALYKALNHGEPFRPARYEVSLADSDHGLPQCRFRDHEVTVETCVTVNLPSGGWLAALRLSGNCWTTTISRWRARASQRTDSMAGICVGLAHSC